MCGITGWVAFERESRNQRALLEVMTATLSRRGPDGHGVWLDRHAGLGHHRLAVVDLPGGAQPMTARTQAGTVALTFSGEVYDFPDLRDELRARGHVFTTRSDTEVVLRGYLEWGDELPRHLDGMYAFAIWDGRVERLLLVRDRLGVKPLYLFPTADGVLFGSEPKAVLAHPEADAVVDLDGLRHMLGYVLTLPGVPWTGMRELPPGTVATVDRRGISYRRYWRLPDIPHTDDAGTAACRVRELLTDAVRRQIHADVPVGLLLSGGLDSSSLAVLATGQRAPAEPLRTFSVDFRGQPEGFVADFERAAPDAPFVRDVVARLRTDHRDVLLEPDEVEDPAVRRAAVSAYDVPPGFGDRDRSMLLLFRRVREHVTVALSGESADELFGGYSWFHDPAVTATGMFPWVTACREDYGVAPEALLPGLGAAVDMETYLADRYATAVSELSRIPGETANERRMRFVSHLHLTHQLPVLLDRKDRLSMAVGLEVRVPYADHRLVEYVHRSPWSLQSCDGREKSLLRLAMCHLLPRSVVERVKTAYPVLRAPAQAAGLADQACALGADANHQVFGIVDRDWLRRAGEAAWAGRPLSARDRNTVEWVLNTAVWCELHDPTLRL